jgi:hypothetical protein
MIHVTMRLKDGDEFTFSEEIEYWTDAVREIAALERIGWSFVSIEVRP